MVGLPYERSAPDVETASARKMPTAACSAPTPTPCPP